MVSAGFPGFPTKTVFGKVGSGEDATGPALSFFSGDEAFGSLTGSSFVAGSSVVFGGISIGFFGSAGTGNSTTFDEPLSEVTLASSLSVESLASPWVCEPELLEVASPCHSPHPSCQCVQ